MNTIIEEPKLQCCNCLRHIEYDYYQERDSEIYCDDCYSDKFQFFCPICEEHHDETNDPQQTYFYLHEQQYSLKPGYYRVKNFPAYRSDGFSVDIYEENVSLESRNICYKKDGSHSKATFSEFICCTCFNEKGLSEYLIQNHIRSRWCKGLTKKQTQLISKITVYMSPAYYNVLNGKSFHKMVRIKMDRKKKTQQLTFSYKFKTQQ